MSEEIYLSIADIPVDVDIPEDEDASNPSRKFPGDEEPRAERALQVARKTPGKFVPFVRELSLGKRGRDVEGIQRALYQAGITKVNLPTNIYGPGTVAAVRRFQKSKGLEVDGIYGPLTHKALASAPSVRREGEQAFDPFAVWLLQNSAFYTGPQPGDKPPTAEELLRKGIVSAAFFGYQHRAEIHYTMGNQRMYGVRNKIYPPKVPIWEDCSSFATWTYYVPYKGNKAYDPNALRFSGFGYTGTLTRNGHVVRTPREGDLGFFGRAWPYVHTVIYVGNGRVVSHGSEGGPYLLEWNYRSDFNHWRSYFA